MNTDNRTLRVGIVQHTFKDDVDSNRAANIRAIENLAADGAQMVTVEDSQTKTVTFDGAAVKEKWLTGSSDAVVNRREA